LVAPQHNNSSKITAVLYLQLRAMEIFINSYE
jgi:hypothetical protein